MKLVRLKRSVEANASSWSQPRGEPRGSYVALVDSAGQGIGASTPQKGYVSLVADRLRDQAGGPVDIVDLSRSGARIEDVLDRQLPALSALARTPDVVTVAIGGLDIRACDRTTFARPVDRWTGALPAGTHVAHAPHFLQGRWERDAQQAAAAARERDGSRPCARRPPEALEAQGAQATDGPRPA